jgi:hypothetical protein
MISISAAAQSSAPPSAKPDASSQKVCQKVEMTGSRVKSKKVCMSRAEWDAARQHDQQAIARESQNRAVRGQ